MNERIGGMPLSGSVQARFEALGDCGVTKRAPLATGDTLREQLGQDDIRITTISPGGFTADLSQGFLPELSNILPGLRDDGSGVQRAGHQRVSSDPQHIANMVRDLVAQGIQLTIQEIMIRLPFSRKV